MNGRFQIAMHILTLLHSAGHELLSSDYIASSANINPALIRKELSALRIAGLVQSKEGKSGGYSLSKAADKISVAEVYKAVSPQSVLGKAKNEANPNCPVGRQISNRLTQLDNHLNQVLTHQLQNTTLADFYQQFDK